MRPLEEIWNPKIGKLQRKAEFGDAKALCQLGDAFREGIEIAQDYERAIDYYRTAAERLSRFNLSLSTGCASGGCYFITIVVLIIPLTFALSFGGDTLLLWADSLFGYAIKIGMIVWIIGGMYGVFRYLLTPADIEDVAYAQFCLGEMAEKGQGEEVNIPKSLRWYKKSAKNGNREAEAALERLKNRDDRGKQT